MRLKSLALVALAVVVAGCGATQEIAAPHNGTTDSTAAAVVRSQKVQNFGKDDARIDPWQRLDQFDLSYRDSLVLENTQNGEKPPPPPLQLDAAWDYVLAGNDFTDAGDLGGASQAYWAALRLVGNAQGRRSDRELVRRTAYLGLANVAKRKNQEQWAELFEMCGGLSNAYLTGGQAEEDQKKLLALQEKVAAARASADQAKQQADSAVHKQKVGTFFQGLAIVGSAVLAGAESVSSGATGSEAALQAVSGGISNVDPDQVVQVVNNVSAIEAQTKAANEEYEKAEKDIDHTETTATAALMEPDQDFAIEAGKSFVAEEAGYYLVRANDQAPYLAVLDQVAADEPQIHSAVQHCRIAQSDEEKSDSVAALAQELRNRELSVARHERLVKAPLPSNSASASIAPPADTTDSAETEAVESDETTASLKRQALSPTTKIAIRSHRLPSVPRKPYHIVIHKTFSEGEAKTMADRIRSLGYTVETEPIDGEDQPVVGQTAYLVTVGAYHTEDEALDAEDEFEARYSSTFGSAPPR